MTHRCAVEHASGAVEHASGAVEHASRAVEHADRPVLPPGSARSGRRARSRTRLFTTWHALRRHIDLCRTSTAMCPATH